MLSIIISSAKEHSFFEVKKNIELSIGPTLYEIIKIFNSGEMSLSSAYNKGASLAKFENLLFLHDDVQFLTQGWGEKLLQTLSLQESGVIGLAGGRKKFKLPTGHDLGIAKYRYSAVIHAKNEKIEKIEEPIEVKTLDGVFLALKKVRWEEFNFNEKIPGFHFYDLDISLRTSQTYQNYIAPDILIHHFSKGNFNNCWIKASLEFHKKDYNFDLPTREEKVLARIFWFRRLLREDISFTNRIKFMRCIGIDKRSFEFAIKFIFNFF